MLCFFAALTFAPSARGLENPEPLKLRCRASLTQRGHKNGVDRPDECGAYVEDGPELPVLSISGQTDATIRHREVIVNLQLVPSDLGYTVGVVRVKPPARDTYSAIARGGLVGDSEPALSLSAYLGEKSRLQKPECSFAHYVTVTCTYRP